VQAGGALPGRTAFDIEQVPVLIVALARKRVSCIRMAADATWPLQNADNFAEKLGTLGARLRRCPADASEQNEHNAKDQGAQRQAAEGHDGRSYLFTSCRAAA
jgi:hypothetical protein